MASSINASTAGVGGVITTADNTGILNIQTAGTTAVTVNASQNVSFTNSANLPNTFGFKNRIINGDMRIDQRNAGASLSATASTFGVDRWQTYSGVNSKYTTQQNAGSVTPPVGFTKYLGVTSSSAYSSAAGDVFSLLQNIEGFNVADLGFGTSNAKTVTLSFWVRSSLTGTFGGSLANNGYTRAYPFSYTISTANTWEQKSVTIAGDTTGTWTTDNSAGIRLYIDLGSGSTYQGTAGSWGGMKTTVTGATSVVGTNGATFYITGVQLEIGSTATSFDVRDYGRELAMCQRYCIVYANTAGGNIRCPTMNYTTTLAIASFTFPVPLRVTPTGIISSAASTYRIYSNGSLFTPSVVATDAMSQYTANTAFTCSGLTAGYAGVLGFPDAGGTSKLEFTGTEL